MQTSKYDDILTSIAGRFYSDLPANKRPTRETCLEKFKADLLNFTAQGAEDPAWKLWLDVQQQCRAIADQQYARDPGCRLPNEEIVFLSEAALHLRSGGHVLRLSTQTIERVSAWKIDRNIMIQDIAGLHLPDYVWIDWPSCDKKIHPPWISRTVGMLVSRFAVFDAPRHRLVPLLERSVGTKDYTCEMIRTLAQRVVDGVPCLGYEIVIVQQDDHGYRFISCVLGHEYTEPLVDMLTLHKEMSDRDKRKYRQAEQVWTNVAIRLLLAASHKGWCMNAEHPIFIGDSEPCVLPTFSHKLYAMGGVERREIAIRPDYRTPFKPFAITNE
jgi:hypothetical protein